LETRHIIIGIAYAAFHKRQKGSNLNPDGSTTTNVTDRNTGTGTETTKGENGTVTVETKKDGTVTSTTTLANGLTAKAEKPAGGAMTAQADITAAVQEAGSKPVALRSPPFP